MTRGGPERFRVFDRFRRAVRGSSDCLRIATLGAVGSWFLRLPGMRPRAPKRNVILGLIYLYAALLLLSIGSV